MSSMYIQEGNRWIPTSRLRIDTNHKDQDLINEPEILNERQLYEERKHLDLASLQEEIIA